MTAWFGHANLPDWVYLGATGLLLAVLIGLIVDYERLLKRQTGDRARLVALTADVARLRRQVLARQEPAVTDETGPIRLGRLTAPPVPSTIPGIPSARPQVPHTGSTATGRHRKAQ